ncbi:hypothetical protein ACH4E7_35740 [Kitasatospora sp. NPDC018058]|uniref:hypothetical protein n=1 Tax=Kitasatospora sp. NPDC018058 TaxID=3364025 RepID=UPI0037C0EAFA
MHYRQHPDKGRYHIPANAVLSRTADGSWVAYLHYGVGSGDDNNINDFLHTYNLPRTGTPAPLPEDLRAALPGDEPAQGMLLPEGRAGRQIFVVERPSDRLNPGAADIYVRAIGT